VEHLEARAALDDLVEDRLELLGVDEVPLGRDDGGMGLSVGLRDDLPVMRVMSGDYSPGGGRAAACR
jgi:hypothetical protein